jgi:hypothetical protein
MAFFVSRIIFSISDPALVDEVKNKTQATMIENVMKYDDSFFFVIVLVVMAVSPGKIFFSFTEYQICRARAISWNHNSGIPDLQWWSDDCLRAGSDRVECERLFKESFVTI